VADAARPIVLRGDRLGEPNARRDPPKTVSLGPGEALVLTDDRQGLQLVLERVVPTPAESTPAPTVAS